MLAFCYLSVTHVIHFTNANNYHVLAFVVYPDSGTHQHVVVRKYKYAFFLKYNIFHFLSC